jgi:hypothetical protein
VTGGHRQLASKYQNVTGGTRFGFLVFWGVLVFWYFAQKPGSGPTHDVCCVPAKDALNEAL